MDRDTGRQIIMALMCAGRIHAISKAHREGRPVPPEYRWSDEQRREALRILEGRGDG